MLHSIAVWLLVAGFAGAGLFNAVGTRATQYDFARWGYPRWCRVTRGLEIVAAALIVFPASRNVGMALGAMIIAVAVVTTWGKPPCSNGAGLLGGQEHLPSPSKR